MATKATDLTTSSPVPSKPTTPRPRDHPVAEPPSLPPSIKASPPEIHNLTFPVKDEYHGSAHGFLHISPSITQAPPPNTAAILLSGAGGGVTGPSGMFLSLGAKLPALASRIPVLRLDYRYPARTKPCVADTQAAMTYLTENFGIQRFVLVGWSFGGAPVYTVAGRDERVVGAATVASQTADALTGAREAGRRGIPVLLMHGTGDQTLSSWCSKNLLEAWFKGYQGKDDELAKLALFEDDDHSLRRNAKKAEEMMANFIVQCAGENIKDGEQGVVKSDVLGDSEQRREIMEKGGDLRGKENIE
ncbi:hypothetical protein H2198_001617 [Neophaeococcomyces mojaviensis]|uniref:Uncharacterized protein n=1 Tax=Neophaeococcomyces mojaviensis TaxID=3383035 RepID=A0ACC3AGJ7_9EURO|nr:hypothetical protein H2198_001617 [Knufia sp. JES_112]